MTDLPAAPLTSAPNFTDHNSLPLTTADTPAAPQTRPAPDDHDLIPVRALNQVVYCQRLYYLEFVEGLMPTNAYVEDGIFQHRRVDDPQLHHRTRTEGDVLHTRSVHLSSERLGITGKLDVLEEKNGLLYPVEYKRGRARSASDDQPPYWDNDAVQLCAQALLLEEHFHISIPFGILYYCASKTRLQVPIDATLRRKTLEAIATIRQLSRQPTPPEPLPPELRHRCFGCSLAPVCQPEETLYCLRQAPALSPLQEQQAGITRVLPEGIEGAVLYLQEHGLYVGLSGEHLMVRKHGQLLQQVPIAAIHQVVVLGNVQISTQALHFLASSQIPVVYLTASGRFLAALQPAPTKNVRLRVNQYRYFSEPHHALQLAKAVVAAKISNQRTLMMRSLRSLHTTPSHLNDTHSTHQLAARDMAHLLARLEHTHDPAAVLGIEGQAAALYFKHFPLMIKNQLPGRTFDFHARNRRPPRDPVNALLSFGYALLLKDCFSVLCTVGFDPYFGFYHASRHGRPSLALDLMEEFRPIIVDSVVLTLINNQSLSPEHFHSWQHACHLNDQGRTRFLQAYEQRKATVVTHPLFGYKMTYARMLEVQARLLAAHIRGDLPHYVGFTVR